MIINLITNTPSQTIQISTSDMKIQCSCGKELTEGEFHICFGKVVMVKGKPMTEEIIKRQEEEFNNKFEWLFGCIKVTPYHGEDVERATQLQETYNKIGSEILNWHTQSIKEILEGMRDKVNDMFSVYPDWRIYDSSEDEELISKQDTVNYLEEVIKKI